MTEDGYFIIREGSPLDPMSKPPIPRKRWSYCCRANRRQGRDLIMQWMKVVITGSDRPLGRQAYWWAVRQEIRSQIRTMLSGRCPWHEWTDAYLRNYLGVMALPPEVLRDLY